MSDPTDATNPGNPGTRRVRFDGSGDAPLIPAATVVLLRPANAGFETLMLRKNRGQSFGGMWVFPGGKVEDDDAPADASEEFAARYAAVREAAEETGVVLHVDDLVPFAYWVPPPEAPKRFSTWFFVAALPDGATDVVIDGGEIGDHVWTTPQGVLDRHAANEVDLAPPTWVSLHGLAQAATVDEALATARTNPVSHHATRIYPVGGTIVTVWEPDAAYESGDLDAPGPRNRLVMLEAGWRYETGEADQAG